MSTSRSDQTGYDPQAVEATWERRWQERRTNSIDLHRAGRPFYNLMMFPYPSAEGLHVGNVFAFVGTDLYGRFRRLQGDDVFEPIGFDAFGIHSENYALKVKTHPAELIPRNIARFRQQLTRVGLMVNGDHAVSTTDPAYYRWTQWIFLQLYKAGLAYKKAAPVNWCPECKTVLANEQVINGYCERHPDTLVSQRVLEQWFFAITKYAQRLLGAARVRVRTVLHHQGGGHGHRPGAHALHRRGAWRTHRCREQPMGRGAGFVHDPHRGGRMTEPLHPSRGMVHVVDDDASVRKSVVPLLKASGFAAEAADGSVPGFAMPR